MLFTTIIPTLLLSATNIIATPLPTDSDSAILKRATGVQIVSNRRPDQCLGTAFIRGARPGIGVTLVPCSSPQALLWDINRGAGVVKVTESNLVLDAAAGYSTANFGFPTTEEPVVGRASQNWYYTDDNRIAVTGDVQCLDDDGSRLQTYQCTTGNTNQIFFTQPPATQPPPFDPYPSIPRSQTYPDPAPNSRRIHPFQRTDLCATVMGNSFRAGNDVAITYCVPDSDPSAKYQLWDIQQSAARVPGLIPLSENRNYCLSSLASNGALASIQPCSGGANTWRWDNQRERFILNGNEFCLDVQSESRPGNETPLNSVRKLQSWQCYEDNIQQKYTFLW